jgi:hypothetical protein
VPQALRAWLWDEGKTEGAGGGAAEREAWLKAGLNATTNRAVIERLYRGIFQRAAAAYAPDYYWLWTPEGWTWDGTTEDQVRLTLDDLAAAVAAHGAGQAPFQLATCGWVLGPQQDRALFDKVLPKHVAVSCINREVGRTPVDRGFADVQGRGKWAIPWLEDDPALTSPQLWAGRMRRDAADARRYGCDGLLGIHWRTRSVGRWRWRPGTRPAGAMPGATRARDRGGPARRAGRTRGSRTGRSRRPRKTGCIRPCATT